MKSINLLPQEAHRQQAAQVALGLAQLSLVGLCAILLLGSVWLQGTANTLAAQVATKQAERATLKGELERAHQLQLELAYIQDRKQAWKDTTKKDLSYATVIRTLAAATPENLRLTNIQADSADELVIAGIAADRSVVSTFINNLNTTGNFVNPTLTQANTQSEGVLFTLTTRYQSTTSQKATP